MSAATAVPAANGERALLQAPGVAWPTLAVFVAALGLWLATLWLADRSVVHPGAALVLGTIAAFAAFTPLHDAAHRSLARSRGVNEVVGRLSARVLLGPFPAFRYVHLEHHKHTNDPALDPDHWSGRGPAWLRPLRWASQDLRYYGILLARHRSRPFSEKAEVVLTLAGSVGLVAAAMASGHGVAALAAWVVPSRLALLLLSFSFDYLPHRPHQVTARESEYRATHVLSDAVLTPLFLYQNYHLIHHLYPGIPFYRYAGVWRWQRDALLARGAEEIRLFGCVVPCLR